MKLNKQQKQVILNCVYAMTPTGGGSAERCVLNDLMDDWNMAPCERTVEGMLQNVAEELVSAIDDDGELTTDEFLKQLAELTSPSNPF